MAKKQTIRVLFVTDKNYHNKRIFKSYLNKFIQMSKQLQLPLTINTMFETNFDMFIRNCCLQYNYQNKKQFITYKQYTNILKPKSQYCDLPTVFYNGVYDTYLNIKYQAMRYKIASTSNDIILFFLYDETSLDNDVTVKNIYNRCKKIKDCDYHIIVQKDVDQI